MGTALSACPRTRPSRSSSSGTSWRPPPSEISPTPASTASTSSPSCTLNWLTVSAALFTPRSSGTDPVKQERTELLHQGSDSKDQDPLEDPEVLEPSQASQELLLECLKIIYVLFLLCPPNTICRGSEIFTYIYCKKKKKKKKKSTLVDTTA